MTTRDVIRRLVEEREDGQPETAEKDPEVRLAVYDSPLAAPQVLSLTAEDLQTFIGELASQTYSHSRQRGGRIPFVVIREVVENLIHAYFRNAVISVMADGNTIRISDQGPGIKDKERAVQPGFTTATQTMRTYIRGVGSGLPVAKEQLAFLGGDLLIEDNLNQGTVVTLALSPDYAPAPSSRVPELSRRPTLSARQKKIMLLIGELGGAGPTNVAKELDISHSTAYRELQALERLDLLQNKGNGKRTLTEAGISFLESIFAP
jgi:anti-sigma regulatory factor (Ser/Thr protein kinase)